MPYNWGWTELELATIRAQLLTGARSVTIGDRTVTFRDIKEIEAIIGTPASAARTTRRVVLISDKGL